MTRLRLASLNLQNLQLPLEPMHPRMKPYSHAEYDKKLAWLAETVQRLDADVLALQEVWAPRALRDLFARAGLRDDYTLLTRGPAEGPGNELSVALAIRKGCIAGAHQWVSDFPREVVLRKRPQRPPAPEYAMHLAIERFSRPLLRCEVRPPQGDPLLVFVVHLKSRMPMELDGEEANQGAIARHARTLGRVLSTVRRTAEAGALRVMLEQATMAAARPLVVMGDINDSLGSAVRRGGGAAACGGRGGGGGGAGGGGAGGPGGGRRGGGGGAPRRARGARPARAAARPRRGGGAARPARAGRGRVGRRPAFET